MENNNVELNSKIKNTSKTCKTIIDSCLSKHEELLQQLKNHKKFIQTIQTDLIKLCTEFLNVLKNKNTNQKLNLNYIKDMTTKIQNIKTKLENMVNKEKSIKELFERKIKTSFLNNIEKDNSDEMQLGGSNGKENIFLFKMKITK